METLAVKIRPKSLNEYVGQDQLVAPKAPLRKAIEEKHLFSFILWGPPGVGKTTLARIYANSLNADFHELSAVSTGKEEVRKIIESTGELFGPKILFLDEIHRFNKAQQDYLLPFVESGHIILIGATTENPSFEVIPALLSRMRVFRLHELSEDELGQILDRTDINLSVEAKENIISLSNGDARQALSILDNVNNLYKEVTIQTIQQSLQDSRLRYDKKGEEHFNTISAFIKSMRASQPDAALYYLARMIEGGEDLKYIARRMVVFASEDIGMKDPHALLIADAVFRAVENIGFPDAGINLSHGVVYLSNALKSRAVYESHMSSMADAKKYKNISIPLKIRNAVTDLLKKEGYGQDYQKYTKEDLLPEKIKGTKYWKEDNA